MKKNSFYSERVKPVVVMAVMTIVCISFISGVYLATLDRVKANQGLVLKKAVLYAGGITLPETNLEMNDLYERQVKEEGDLYIISDNNNNVLAYAFIEVGPGLWGEIQVMTAFTPDLEEFVGIDFIKQNETPGLGARITEAWYKEQLRGKLSPLTMVPEGEAQGNNEIDAITGATRTSDYMLQILTNAAESALKLKGRVSK